MGSGKEKQQGSRHIPPTQCQRYSSQEALARGVNPSFFLNNSTTYFLCVYGAFPPQSEQRVKLQSTSSARIPRGKKCHLEIQLQTKSWPLLRLLPSRGSGKPQKAKVQPRMG